VIYCIKTLKGRVNLKETYFEKGIEKFQVLLQNLDIKLLSKNWKRKIVAHF